MELAAQSPSVGLPAVCVAGLSAICVAGLSAICVAGLSAYGGETFGNGRNLSCTEARRHASVRCPSVKTALPPLRRCPTEQRWGGVVRVRGGLAIG
jgi:hypothetical protein